MAKHAEVDSHKLIFHPERVAEFRKKGDCYPVYVEIGLTNVCNHRCVFCALDFLKKKGDFFDKDVLISNLRHMAEKGVKSVMFAGEGEPLLHKNIGLFVQKAKEFGLDVSITTNGILFDKEKIEQCLPNLSWIRFSIDSGDAENYAKIHGTGARDFEILMDNIRESVVYRNKNNLKATIGSQFLIIPHNIEQAPVLAGKLKKIGADNLQIKPYSKHPNSINDLCVDSLIYNQLKEQLMKFDSADFKILFREATIERIEEGINYPACYGLPFFALIDARGNVNPCNLFYDDDEFIYGNLYEQTFPEIWESERRKQILSKLKERGVANCRKGCRLDVINRYLHRLENPHPHDNFI